MKVEIKQILKNHETMVNDLGLMGVAAYDYDKCVEEIVNKYGDVRDSVNCDPVLHDASVRCNGECKNCGGKILFS